MALWKGRFFGKLWYHSLSSEKVVYPCAVDYVLGPLPEGVSELWLCSSIMRAQEHHGTTPRMAETYADPRAALPMLPRRRLGHELRAKATYCPLAVDGAE